MASVHVHPRGPHPVDDDDSVDATPDVSEDDEVLDPEVEPTVVLGSNEVAGATVLAFAPVEEEVDEDALTETSTHPPCCAPRASPPNR